MPISVKSIQHYLQMRTSDEDARAFKQFDYGFVENMKRYDQPIPPVFDLGLIKQKVRLYCGTKDKFMNIYAMSAILVAMQNSEEKEFEKKVEWGHQTFYFGKDLGPFVDTMERSLK